jgi:hypothetical protein
MEGMNFQSGAEARLTLGGDRVGTTIGVRTAEQKTKKWRVRAKKCEAPQFAPRNLKVKNTTHMTRTTKILLSISLTAFAFGFTNVLWGLGTPIGAICFGLFLIFRILGRETSLYDKEQQLRLGAAEAQQACPIVDRDANELCMAAGTAHRGTSSA